jgi:hypothetical protein
MRVDRIFIRNENDEIKKFLQPNDKLSKFLSGHDFLAIPFSRKRYLKKSYLKTKEK